MDIKDVTKEQKDEISAGTPAEEAAELSKETDLELSEEDLDGIAGGSDMAFFGGGFIKNSPIR